MASVCRISYDRVARKWFAYTILAKPGTWKKFYMLVDWITCKSWFILDSRYKSIDTQSIDLNKTFDVCGQIREYKDVCIVFQLVNFKSSSSISIGVASYGTVLMFYRNF